MGLYRRYFRVTHGPLFDAAKAIEQKQIEAKEAFRAITDSVGAKDIRTYGDGRFAGFDFDEAPGSDWKPYGRGQWAPKKSTKKGKEIWRAIDALPVVRGLSHALRAVGLSGDGFPVLIESTTGHVNTITGHSSHGVYFVGVPWKDIDPEDLRKYREEKAEGLRFSQELEHLSWIPAEGMEEVKRWQVEKEVEEINARINKGGE